MEKSTRREFLKKVSSTAASAAMLSVLPYFSGCDDESYERPNIIFVMADDHSANAVSCYGSKINKTPNIDRLAQEGMKFSNCFCTNSICVPSRAVILTGKYSHINGVTGNWNVFDGSMQTLPKLMQKAGYQTAMIGKWHLGSVPTGFDHYSVLIGGLGEGQGTYIDPEFLENSKEIKVPGYVTDIITDKAIDWLDGRDLSKPFFLMCHHKASHSEWIPDDKYADLYEDEQIAEPATFDDDYATRSLAAYEQKASVANDMSERDLKGRPPEGLSEHERKKWKYQRYIKDYLRCVASMDDNIGRVLNYLDEKGLSDNTIVVYTSDQGFFLGEHGWYDKRFMYEESLRMPLLIRYPKKVKGGSVNDDMVLNLDFAPTLLDCGGVGIPKDIQGRSFRANMLGRTPSNWRKSIYYHYYDFPSGQLIKRHYGIRTERYKLIHFYYDIDEWELYDLHKDPNELNNLYGQPGYAEITENLKNELNRLRKQYGDSDELAERYKQDYFQTERGMAWKERYQNMKKEYTK